MTSAEHSRADPSPALRARALGHAYRVGWRAAPRDVLRDVELDAPRGAALALIGPNGSGKSTLLRLLAGLETPRSGTLEVLGRAPIDAAARALVGYCPEDSPWPGELECLEALELRAASDGHARARARELARTWLARVGLAHAARTRLSNCSRGMRRRFGLAQALLGDPELLLLDEASAGLDADGVALYDGLLDAARARGATIVSCAHELADLSRHCDRCVVLLDGRIAASGSLHELCEQSRELELHVQRDDTTSIAALRHALESAGARDVRIGPGAGLLVELYARVRADAAAARGGAR